MFCMILDRKAFGLAYEIEYSNQRIAFCFGYKKIIYVHSYIYVFLPSVSTNIVWKVAIPCRMHKSRKWMHKCFHMCMKMHARDSAWGSYFRRGNGMLYIFLITQNACTFSVITSAGSINSSLYGRLHWLVVFKIDRIGSVSCGTATDIFEYRIMNKKQNKKKQKKNHNKKLNKKAQQQSMTKIGISNRSNNRNVMACHKRVIAIVIEF